MATARQPVEQSVVLPGRHVFKHIAQIVAVDSPLSSFIEEIGEANLVMASDYPHWDAGFPMVVQEFKERTDLTDRQKQLITCENIRELMDI